jgi:dipeptidase E
MAGRRAHQIIAIGGAAFSAEPKNFALDRYILDQAEGDRPRVLLIPTATGESDAYIAKFYAAYSSLDARASHVTFFQRTPALRDLVLRQDVVFVGGGNTRSMLAVWREWGLPDVLREASASGVVLGGVSAGAICWFEQGITDSWADALHPLDCLGFLQGSCCPHYDGEPERRPSYHALLGAGRIAPGIAIEDGVAAHFVGGALERVVTKREGARAYRMSVRPGTVVEDPIDAQLLPKV